ncbi:anthranilate synthase component I [Methanosalsum zhilinae DSM 4017]|uniref:Anthranilate synthase component 1 n=1 Tax=Methanosalsum zhilinae (strain DSM 4017 / NBRC 107636 / OCM 62 / WeN5) TaxID=679901 RepID=F7XN97_METZD|nr:anthranilate synthase component I [Methanosalsum zhilinae]AEH60055.1 anthranilate synthase component I [Methanosalsum zhilinae DSM 4017]
MISFDLTKNQFTEIVRQSGNYPAIVQLMAAVDTASSPLQLYSQLQDHEYSYLLESVEKEKRHARFSFVGSDPDLVISIKERQVTASHSTGSPLAMHITSKMKSVCIPSDDIDKKCKIRDGMDVLDALGTIFPGPEDTNFLNFQRFDRQTFLGGAIGYNGYDIVYDCWLDRKRKYDSGIPDMQFAFTGKTFLFDHLENRTYIVLTPLVTEKSNPEHVYDQALSDAADMYRLLKEAEQSVQTEQGMPALSSTLSCNMGSDEFRQSVTMAKEHIIEGDIFQVVLSRKYIFDFDEKPFKLYNALRNINPSPYMYLLNFRDLSIVGASPETLLTVHNRKVITNPIAGTCSRGQNESEDDKYASHMLNDEKERAEHVMLVDLGRNDVRMVSKGGTVKVEDLMSVVKYSHVQHIESTVTGILRDECNQFDATRAIFPAGTLSGAPKIRAMEIIDDLEKSARGVYGGGAGYYTWNGDADFAIVIRTVVINNGTASIQAGAGIVADSDPEYEYRETERKMAAMIRSIGAGAQ